jgi:cytochrome c
MFTFRLAVALLGAGTLYGQLNLGRPVGNEELAKLDITILPDGSGLPAGSGSAAAGAQIYAQKCQSCHGANGAGGPFDRLTGGVGSLTTDKPVRTAVSYWPSATTIFDYIRRAMPRNEPKSLTNDETYALTAFLLSVDNVVPKDATLDAKSLPAVKMPNQDGFVSWWPRRK